MERLAACQSKRWSKIASLLKRKTVGLLSKVPPSPEVAFSFHYSGAFCRATGWKPGMEKPVLAKALSPERVEAGGKTTEVRGVEASIFTSYNPPTHPNYFGGGKNTLHVSRALYLEKNASLDPDELWDAGTMTQHIQTLFKRPDRLVKLNDLVFIFLCKILHINSLQK